jgi:alkylhydroperoxidase family enzyme
MARLPYVDPAAASEPVRDALERVPPLNIFRMMANADTAFRPWLRWGAALLGQLELDPLLRELAILRVARLTPHAEYEWVQHVAIAHAVGATEEQVAALERDEPDAGCFSDAERHVLRFTTEVVRDARASEDVLEALKQTLSPREIVELLMVIGNYMMVARVMATTDMELDEPAGLSALQPNRDA